MNPHNPRVPHSWIDRHPLLALLIACVIVLTLIPVLGALTTMILR